MRKTIYLFIISFLFLGPIHISAQGWNELGGLNALAANGVIYTICSDAAGNIYAAGNFTDDSSTYYVAKYNGTSWSELGGPGALHANVAIATVCTDPAGNVYAAGEFLDAIGTDYVAKWNGTSWSELGGLGALGAMCTGNVAYALSSICSDPSGHIYVAGSLFDCPTDGPSSYNSFIAEYNGSAWVNLGGYCSLHSFDAPSSVCLSPAGAVYTNASHGDYLLGTDTAIVAEYSGGWNAIGGDYFYDGKISVNELCSDPSGNIYAACTQSIAGIDSYYVTKWNGTAWSRLGGASDGNFNGSMQGIASDLYGNIYVGGSFTNASFKYYVAQYNGSIWSELGGPNALDANLPIGQICADPFGNIYAAGAFTNTSSRYYVAKYGDATGIHELAGSNTIKLSPNPTAASLTISSGQNLSDATIRLIDLTGQVLTEKTNQSGASFTLDISNQAAGLYFVEVLQAGDTWTGKLVKE